ncbi:MAG: hypothetical protein ABEI52_03300, partial [Halobacteriaceae archaeon]
ENQGGGERAVVRILVNGVEMTSKETYFADEMTLPLAMFGANADVLTYRVEVIFPELPVSPTSSERTIDVV